jgi:hypothetical protein
VVRLALGIGEYSGRWSGLIFHDSNVGVDANSASSVQHSRIEFAQVALYAQDDIMDRNAIRDEDALRIISNRINYNLIGISLDGYSPVVANNIIQFTTSDLTFDNLNFGGGTPRTTACSLPAGTRFQMGHTGPGIFICKRKLSTLVAVDPLFYKNTISDNPMAGLWVQQPGVGVSYGTASSYNRPKPLFGRYLPPIETAHEFSNIGKNWFGRNGTSDIPFNIVYNVQESPADQGVASLNHAADMPAFANYWETTSYLELLGTLRDGRLISTLGEVVLEGPDDIIMMGLPSEVEDSTLLYE